MSISSIHIDEIEESHLIDLKKNEVREGKVIEYKLRLPEDNVDSKKEFLSDVSSFANSIGGDLLFGVKEDDGLPIEITGIENEDIDAIILRLENIIRDGIEPRIVGISVKDVKLNNGNMVIVIRIPNSWTSPHIVSYRNHSRFYARNSAGKYQLDVSEIRSHFLVSEKAGEKIALFRADRISKIINGDIPVEMKDKSAIVIHAIPLSISDPGINYDISVLTEKPSSLEPLYSAGWNHHYNFDGFVTYSNYHGTDKSFSYLQLFRSGAIETVSSSLLIERGTDDKFIPSTAFEKEVIKTATRLINRMHEMEVTLPIFISVGLLNVEGYRMGVDQRYGGITQRTIDRKHLLPPQIAITNYEINVAQALKPIFDTIWNACGWPKSINYDDMGNWHEKY